MEAWHLGMSRGVAHPVTALGPLGFRGLGLGLRSGAVQEASGKAELF